MSIAKKCKIENCTNLLALDSKTGKRSTIKGFCITHYHRFRRYGDTSINKLKRDKTYRLIDGYAELPVYNKGVIVYAKVDLRHRHLSRYSWSYSNGYAVTTINNKRASMHSMILKNGKKGHVIDHINMNTLDNRSKNLRILTIRENVIYSKKRSSNTTGYTGVQKRGSKWASTITNNNKKIWLGTYSSKEEASAAYNKAAKNIFGELAHEK